MTDIKKIKNCKVCAYYTDVILQFHAILVFIFGSYSIPLSSAIALNWQHF